MSSSFTIDPLGNIDQVLDIEEVLDVTEIEKSREKERKERKRRLERLLHPTLIPSFLAVISPDAENNDTIKPKRIRINVDEYLGLFKDQKHGRVGVKKEPSLGTLPSDEGYFEGAVPLSLQDDSQYVGEFHLLIRSQLEIFSATDDDVRTTQTGRRNPTTRGKVGLRCIHCARVALQQDASVRYWPPGAVSYPVNIAGIYSVCYQKPNQHFAICPSTPHEIKSQIYRLTSASVGQPRGRPKEQSGHTAISASMYYTIAAKRIGLIDVFKGIRFGRDLKLEPLSVESVRAQMEDPSLLNRKAAGTAALSSVASSSTTTVSRITADEESERVLAEAIAEKDDENMLGRSDDSKLVTSFLFLCVRQMSICHVVPSDFVTRGKKTKLMRLGFAGFCCRHCNKVNNPETSGNVLMDFSCRSFASAPDNLASAISNSFYAHLHKCQRVPLPVRKALAAYKKIHSKQIARLPHGSQRRLFQAMWNRLRAADVSKEELEERLEKVKHEQADQASTAPQNDKVPSVPTANSSKPAQVLSGNSIPDSVTSGVDSNIVGRPANYPACGDPETQDVLKAAEEDTNISRNDNLILPGDRLLISDYVFLMMKQLKIAVPVAMDFARGRRTTVLNAKQAGLGCMHCYGKAQGSTGRSFPSQPDNLASSLNTSLYQHFQKCPHTPESIKRALVNLKKFHSQQCSTLRFGAQRKYFNLVFQRLRAVKVEEFNLGLSVVDGGETMANGRNLDDLLQEYSFMRVSGSCFQCQRCRMVPFSLRAKGAVMTSIPKSAMLKAHADVCRGESFCLEAVVDALKTVFAKHHPHVKPETITGASFRPVVSGLLGGNEELINIFTHDAVKQYGEAKEEIGTDKALWKFLPTELHYDAIQKEFHVFAESLPSPKSLQDSPAFIRYFQTISPAFVVPPASTATEALRPTEADPPANNGDNQ